MRSRMTNQRRAVLSALMQAGTHPTAYEIYEIVRRAMPHISLGTVYRNLDVLTELGVIQKIESAGAQRRFDADVDSHSHVRCLRCGKIENDHVDIAAPAASGVPGYDVTGYRLELLGLCHECKAAGAVLASAGLPERAAAVVS